MGPHQQLQNEKIKSLMIYQNRSSAELLLAELWKPQGYTSQISNIKYISTRSANLLAHIKG